MSPVHSPLHFATPLASTLFSFSFNGAATPEIYTLSPTRRSSDLSLRRHWLCQLPLLLPQPLQGEGVVLGKIDRKSTRLNSSHRCISYAVFCLKKKKGDRTLADFFAIDANPVSGKLSVVFHRTTQK